MNEDIERFVARVAVDALRAINAAWKPLKKPAKVHHGAWRQRSVHFRPGSELPAISELVGAVKRSKFVRFMTPPLGSNADAVIQVAEDPSRGTSVRVTAQYDPPRDTTWYRLDCIGSKS